MLRVGTATVTSYELEQLELKLEKKHRDLETCRISEKM